MTEEEKVDAEIDLIEERMYLNKLMNWLRLDPTDEP
jgi:hypothetical protein